MLTRRGFATCALCAVAGFIATGVDAQTANTGVKRIILKQMDGPSEGFVTINARVEIEAGATIARHTHPGIESTYVVEGAVELAIEGQETKTYAAGDAFQVPTGAIHGGKNGDKKSVLAAHYIVDKSKPLATLV